jgi:membrane-associated phospholipid phosphatase
LFSARTSKLVSCAKEAKGREERVSFATFASFARHGLCFTRIGLKNPLCSQRSLQLTLRVHWLKALDVGLFRFINDWLANPIFDWLMPVASGNKYSFPLFIGVVVVGGIIFMWKGGKRARLCGLMLALIIWPGDSFVINRLKHTVARPRPYVQLENVRFFGKRTTPDTTTSSLRRMERIGSPDDKPGYNSFPSSHSANWFAATMIFLIFYRRSWKFILPVASLVAFSRIYNGVHFPSDVLSGAIIGAGYGVAGIWAINALWIWAGRRWFPLWWEQLPSLVISERGIRNAEYDVSSDQSAIGNRQSEIDRHWLHLGYAFLIIMLAVNLAYIGSGLIQLLEDESYQWLWSKHLALSYYSKPPLIAYIQFLGTHLFGDTEFGVRFFAPVMGALTGLLVLQFFAREVNARAGFLALLIFQATPLLALGTVVMTIDAPSVLFWTAAMFSGWRAVQPDGKISHWCWTGLWMGLGFLSKYTELFQLLSWILFFALWKPSRIHLRKPGPYLALLINLLCSLPVLIWNAQHDWITVQHLENRAGAGNAWKPTLRYFWEFLGSEIVLLNVIFFFSTLWAAIAFWRRKRNARLIYFFSMGAPVFLIYLALSFHSRVQPNWIAPSIIPLFCLSVIYWDEFLQRSRALKILQTVAIAGGITVILVLHDTNLIGKIVGRPLPPKPEPLTRVRAYDEMARIVGKARGKLFEEGKPVFIIADHYGRAGEISFYLPEAKMNVKTEPLVYSLATGKPDNQFYFWPGYRETRKGQNAIFVCEIASPPLVDGWFWKWLHGETNLLEHPPVPMPPPPELLNDFESVTNLGLRSALYRGRIFHTLQLFECRNLK